MITSVGILAATKTANQDVTSSTALVDVSSLGVPIQANCNYAFEAFLPFALAGILGGIKVAINGPASPTGIVYRVEIDNMTSGAIVALGLGTALDAATGFVIASIASHAALIRGVVRNGATAGTLIPRFAQQTSDGSASSVLAGATFKVWQT